MTHLDEKPAEVLGLAQAATKKVATLARREKETELLELLQQMGNEASELERRCAERRRWRLRSEAAAGPTRC